MEFLEAIKGRHSSRAYLNQPVSDETLRAILDAARWTPSGGNMQPWQVAVVQGESLKRLSAAILTKRAAGVEPNPDYSYYPQEWFEPYKGRRRDTGLGLYSVLGIGREDRERRRQAWDDNYRFFGAPVGLLLFLDRRLGQGSWLDLGAFLQSLLLAATDAGLASCPQASLADYPDIVRNELGYPEESLLLGGIALGYPDPQAAANRFQPPRAEVDEFTRWFD